MDETKNFWDVINSLKHISDLEALGLFLLSGVLLGPIVWKLDRRVRKRGGS